MKPVEEITKENWEEILEKIKYDDTETKEYLKKQEEKILDILLDNPEDTLEEKRKQYVKNVVNKHVTEGDFNKVYDQIDTIRKNQGASILQFGNRLPGSSNVVFEFGEKIVKFGKPFTIINNRNILQPEFEIDLDDGYYWMTVFERMPIVYTVEDKELAQKMYNRVRDDGLVWFDAIGYNIGKTEKVRDENDDGLRIIDAQYMEYETDIFMRIQPERNERYAQQGIGAYDVALKDYIMEHGYGAFEREYQEMRKERRNNANKKDLEVVAKQSSIGGLQKVKQFFDSLIHRREKIEDNERDL